MIWLVDTNVLLRLTEVGSNQHLEAQKAIDMLLEQDITLCVLLQNVSEFWNVCTWSNDKNGFGFTIAQADTALSKIELVFDILPDSAGVYQTWRELIVKHSVSGIKVHDAKIAAAMKAHDIQNLLTFNTKDFRRYTGVNAVEPKNV